MFDLLQRHNLPCFYEAIHVAGFHRAHVEHQDLHKRSLMATAGSQFKVSRNPPAPESLHVALFQGLYGRIVAFCLERQRVTLRVEVRTDRVDSPIVKRFEEIAAGLLNYEARIEKITAYDMVERKVIEKRLVHGVAAEASRLPIIVEQLDLEVTDNNDGLVLAADVLANSLAHLFHTRSQCELFRPLNSVEAILDHPLRENLATFHDPGTYDFSDTFYAHPLRR
jgi:hypothetical protein